MWALETGSYLRGSESRPGDRGWNRGRSADFDGHHADTALRKESQNELFPCGFWKLCGIY